ncbi:MAG: site-specific DNA-methyltransferase [Candidatus Heimdallarchaeota archaeon]|nr:site-specific DNA-methyltransferase [Candidatus Heimdallarchaeota archaeon]MCG3252328.1 class I SAM-dependent methyltransferase [Candidatus Heimdallarchaeota archaeon]MCK4289466.1 class I SAM-dependent methyltransferase [Candidatus Heimdallarchaeota archaeon]
MKTYVALPCKKKRKLPAKFRNDDNRFSENYVEYILKNYTKKGDIVLDIFAGLGTTLFVAEEMDRVPYGIEYVKERYEYIKENLKNKANIIHGDSLKLLEYDLPKCDFCFGSPPFMGKNSTVNPFTAYTEKGNYEQYIQDFQKIYSQLKEVMKPDAIIAVDTANLKNEKVEVTTLAWDVGKSISKVLHFNGEIIIIWESRESKTVDGRSEPWRVEGTFGYGYDHSYCLLFQNK